MLPIKKDRVVSMACFDQTPEIPADLSITNRINRFLATPPFVIGLMLLTGVANLFSLELAAYTVFSAVAVYTCLFANDLLALTPLFICCYLTPSAGNNPGRNAQSVFSGGSGIYFACLGALMAIALIIRVIRDRRRFFGKKRRLLGGMLVLLGAYLLSGVGSADYGTVAGKNLLFALVQGAAIILPYWILSGGIDWKHVRRDYFAWVGFSAGGILVLQILWIYLGGNVVIDGIIQRKQIYTGWGMYNNMGVMLAMMIPYAFCLATKYRRGWIGTVVGSVFLLCVLLSCSRSSILAASGIYAVCVFLMLHYARNRRHNTLALVIFISAAVLIGVLFHDQLLRLFSDLLGRGLDPSSRDDIYKEGLALFGQNPVFGSTFYPPDYQPWDFSTVDAFSGIFPPRWHNTVIQLLASCGIVGLVAYGLHRVQTVRLFWKQMDKENAFVGCSLLVLLVGSLFDCHFFNIGPTLLYSVALAFAEYSPEDK